MRRKLYIDIETAMAEGTFWGRSKYEQEIITITKDWYILSIAYRWSNEKTIHCLTLPDFPLYKKDPHNDRELVRTFAGLLEESPIVLGHNGDGFDLKKIHARMIRHGLPPPPKYDTIDTLKICRKRFGFTSNSLNDVCAFLGIGNKLPHTGKDLWHRCQGDTYDPQAWGLLARYNKHDIYLLYELERVLLPWIENHPALGLMKTSAFCPNCGGVRILKNGFYPAANGEHQRWRCRDCGKSSYERKPMEKFIRALK